MLLTSGGVTNPSIEAALVELLGRPIAESSALVIPTASYGHRGGGAGAWRFLTGSSPNRMVALGWASLEVLELSALALLDPEWWVPRVRGADALLANGGDALFLAHWMRESGLADLLGSLEGVWVGLSAGSMVMTPRIGDDFKVWDPPGGGDAALGVVGFSIFPHLDNPALPENTLGEAERWAAGLGNPAYAVDDDSAIRVVEGRADVVSEGHWRYLTP